METLRKRKADIVKSTRVRPTRHETAGRLLEGALVVFAERGFHGARLEDICARAGLTRGAFYSGFASKAALFLALYDRVIAQVEVMMDRGLAAATKDATDPIAAFLATTARNPPMGRDWYLLNAEFTLYAIRHPSAATALAIRRAELCQLIVDRLGKLLARQGRVFTNDPDILARAVIALSDGGLGQHLLEPDAIAPSALTTSLLPSLLLASSKPEETE